MVLMEEVKNNMGTEEIIVEEATGAASQILGETTPNLHENFVIDYGHSARICYYSLTRILLKLTLKLLTTTPLRILPLKTLKITKDGIRTVVLQTTLLISL